MSRRETSLAEQVTRLSFQVQMLTWVCAAGVALLALLMMIVFEAARVVIALAVLAACALAIVLGVGTMISSLVGTLRERASIRRWRRARGLR